MHTIPVLQAVATYRVLSTLNTLPVTSNRVLGEGRRVVVRSQGSLLAAPMSTPTSLNTLPVTSNRVLGEGRRGEVVCLWGQEVLHLGVAGLE